MLSRFTDLVRFWGNVNCDFKNILTPIVIRAKPSRLRPFYPQDQAGVAIKEANLVAISPRLSLLSAVEGNLYIPSTINTDYLLWHKQLIMCALAYFDPKTTFKSRIPQSNPKNWLILSPFHHGYLNSRLYKETYIHPKYYNTDYLLWHTQKYSRLRCLLRVKGLVTYLFLFGLVWQYSTNQNQYNKGRLKVMSTYLQQ